PGAVPWPNARPARRARPRPARGCGSTARRRSPRLRSSWCASLIAHLPCSSLDRGKARPPGFRGATRPCGEPARAAGNREGAMTVVIERCTLLPSAVYNDCHRRVSVTIITVTAAKGRLDLEQRRELAETLTDAVLVPEVGQFAPAARVGFQVHFVERERDMM